MISASYKQLQQKLKYTLLKPYCHSWWISKMQSDILEERYAIKFCFELGKNAMQWNQRPRDRFPSGSMLTLPDQRLPDGANPPTNFWWSRFWQHWHDLHALGSHLTDSQQGILCWGFKGVQEEVPSEEASTLQNGSVAFPPGECTSPQLHTCHRLVDQNGHQDNSSASLYSRPCSLWLLVIP